MHGGTKSEVFAGTVKCSINLNSDPDYINIMITAIPELLETIAIKDQIITIDAMGT